MDEQANRERLDLPSHGVLAKLAQDDPVAYEALRRELIESFIDAAPEKIQRRLRGLQFRVDGLRQVSGSPLGATIRVYKLMWESFYRLNDEIAGLGVEAAGNGGEIPPESARILEFRRPHFDELRPAG